MFAGIPIGVAYAQEPPITHAINTALGSAPIPFAIDTQIGTINAVVAVLLMKFVSTQEGEDLAKKHATLFIETSAKSAEHVQSAFQELVTRIHQTKAKNEQPKSLDISNNYDANNAGWCC